MPVRRYPGWAELRFPPATAADTPVAFCADLSPASVLDAYRHGIIPIPAPDEFFRTVNEVKYEDQVADGTIAVVGGDARDDPYWVAWWSPDPRPVIAAGHAHLGRNARKNLRRRDMRTTANAAFRQVAQECRAGREPRWLTDTLLDTLTALHDDGWAHSIEVWLDGELAGGAIGIGIGGVLSGDSLFSRHPDGARIAVADMAARLGQAGGLFVDAQWDSAFLRSLGAQPLPRADFAAVLAAAPQRVALDTEPLPARRLLDAMDDPGRPA